MSEKKTEAAEEETPAETPGATSRSRRPPLSTQALGAVIGALAAMAVLRIGTQAGWWSPVNETRWILGGAFIGSMATSVNYYDRAGAYLTGRQSEGNKKILALNIFVSLLGMLVIGALVFGLSSLIGMLFFSK